MRRISRDYSMMGFERYTKGFEVRYEDIKENFKQERGKDCLRL